MQNVAVVLAGGTGKRFGGEIPKQFVEVEGRRVIEYSVDVFSSFVEIQKVLVVCNVNFIPLARKIFKSNPKVEVIEGGVERSDSSRKAIEFLAGEFPKNVLIHDGARPLVSRKIIQNCIDELATNKAVLVAVPVTQTVSVVENMKIVQIPKRKNIFVHQTPQCFRFEVIKNAFQKSNEFFTDDISAIISQVDVKIVEGSYDNIKITNFQDVVLMKEILQKNLKSAKI